MKVLVTGGAGFIGSHVADACIARGDEVIAFDDLTTGRIRNIAHLLDRPDFSFVEGSVVEADSVRGLIAEADIVVHAAAAVGMMLVVENPMRTFESNVKGSDAVFKAAAEFEKRVLFLSTSEVYGLNPQMPIAESAHSVLGSPWKARWSYAYSKIAAEVAAMGYVRRDGADIGVVRLFNTVGPRQRGHYGMVIPRFVERALSGQPLIVHGDGTQSRAFAAVEEVAGAIAALAHAEDIRGEVYNLGSSREISILALARRVLQLTGSRSGIEFAAFDEVYEPEFEEVMRRVPDITKVQGLIGFRPYATVDEILCSVIEEHERLRAAV